MAFQAPNTRQELANLKILEDLQLKKQLLLKQGATQTLNSTVTAPLRLPTTNTVAPTDVHMSAVQRQALQHATSTSFGSFVSQDSSFGNLILPVLPRFDTNPVPSK